MKLRGKIDIELEQYHNIAFNILVRIIDEDCSFAKYKTDLLEVHRYLGKFSVYYSLAKGKNSKEILNLIQLFEKASDALQEKIKYKGEDNECR